MKRVSAIPVAALFALIAGATAFASTPDTLVSNGSPTTPFSQNKQNEPTITADANAPNVLVAGSNDEIDEQGCNGSSCPFTAGIRRARGYFSVCSGSTRDPPALPALSAAPLPHRPLHTPP